VPSLLDACPKIGKTGRSVGQVETNTMKPSIPDLAASAPEPVFPKSPHRLRPNSGDPAVSPNAKKRENTFSQSRDTREDRGTRQMKTTHNAQSFSRSTK
jgi:hypothetical protein